jgi:hypothetical protein
MYPSGSLLEGNTKRITQSGTRPGFIAGNSSAVVHCRREEKKGEKE